MTREAAGRRPAGGPHSLRSKESPPLGGVPLADVFSLEDRVAIVTGGSRGIGRMIAEGFVLSGAHVVITARSVEECAAAAEAMSVWGSCEAIPADLSTLAGIDDFVAAVRQRLTRVDVLVNNAGAAWGEPFEEFSEHGWDKVMDLNLRSPFFLSQRLLPLMRRTDSGGRSKIINVGSVDGISLGRHETYSYHASKAGLHHLTRRMALRLVEDGIVVTSLAPGAFATKLNRDAAEDGEQHAAEIPAARLGEPVDMAAAAIYLASRAGDYVLGETLVVDGGVTLSR